MNLNSKNILTNYLSKYNLSDSDMEKLKSVELEMLIDIYNSAKKRDIKINLAYGTFLGAVRHQGYIPWDDDIDIAVMLDDIPKLIEAIKEDYQDKYYFGGILAPNNPNPFHALKVIKKDTIAMDVSEAGYPFETGIFVDIFPIFHTSDNSFIRSVHEKKLKFLIHATRLGFEYKYPPKNLFKECNEVKKYFKLRRFIGFFFSPFIKLNQKILRHNYKRFKKSNTFAIEAFVGFKKHDNMTLDDVSNQALYDFEGLKFPSFKNYDKMLKMTYGNTYMELPPVEKRERHTLYKLKF